MCGSDVLSYNIGWFSSDSGDSSKILPSRDVADASTEAARRSGTAEAGKRAFVRVRRESTQREGCECAVSGTLLLKVFQSRELSSIGGFVCHPVEAVVSAWARMRGEAVGRVRETTELCASRVFPMS